MNATKSGEMIRMMAGEPTPFDSIAVRYILTGRIEPDAKEGKS